MKTNRFSHLIIIFCFSLSACGQTTGNRNVDFFKQTKAYDLAKAVYASDISKIENLVKSDTSLLTFNNPTSGSNVLALSIYTEKYDALKKLLELGGNPNSINPLTKESLLMESITPFGSQFEWRQEHQYAKLLLESGANPNYTIEKDSVNEKGYSINASNPIVKASSEHIELLKVLIKHGAEYNIRVNGKTPFAHAVSGRKFDIINYYIDTLKVNVHEPMRIRSNDSLFIQDYIHKFMNYEESSDNYIKTQVLIDKLKKMGIDFENYDYKLK